MSDNGSDGDRRMNATVGAVRGTTVSGFDHEMLAESSWDNLVARSETSSVFQTSAWHRSWWAAFGDAYDPRVMVLSRGSRMVGLAPFVVDRRTPGVLRFMGDGRADYCDFIASREDKRSILKSVFSALAAAASWSVVELNNVPSMSGTIEEARALCRDAGFGFRVDHQFVCPSLLILEHQEAALKIFNKASLRRPEKVLARSGRVTYRVLTSHDDVVPLLDAFFDQHIRRWTATSTPSLFLDARNREFYRGLTARLAPRGWLHFSTVEFEGEPIAFHFGFDFGGVVTWYKPSFAIEHAAHSPGMVMLRHLIGDAIEQGRSELDFTVGDEPFKRRFTNTVRNTSQIRVFREPATMLIEQSRRAVVDVAKWVSRRAPLRGAFGRLKS